MASARSVLQFTLVMVLVGLTGGFLMRGSSPLVPTPQPSPRDGVLSTASFSPPAQAAPQVVQIGSAFPSDLRRPPTGDKDQSKLWFHGVSWWGVLASQEAAAFTLHRLDWSRREWVDTGVVVDDRIEARADVLWDGDHLHVVSAGTASSVADRVLFSRYTYESGNATYQVDDGFPIALNERGVAGARVAEDAAGDLWVSYIVDGGLEIRHSADAGETWSEPFGLPEAERGVVAHTAVQHGDRLALLWSNQSAGTVQYTTHADADPPSSWSEPTIVVEGAFLTDDHITARSLGGGDDGPTLFAMVKTSADLQPESDRDDPQMLLLEKQGDGDWRQYVVGRVRDRHTRPLLVVEEDRRVLHIFVVAPFGAGAVYYKTTPADDIALVPGRGAPFLDLPEQDELTNPTSTKQNVTRASGIVVLASDLETDHYVMGALPLH